MLMTKRKPVTVGEILLEEYMQPLGLTQGALAEAMGVQRKHVNELCNGRRNVTAPTALILARVFGNSPDFWLNVQRRNDLWEAMHSPKERRNQARPAAPDRRLMAVMVTPAYPGPAGRLYSCAGRQGGLWRRHGRLSQPSVSATFAACLALPVHVSRRRPTSFTSSSANPGRFGAVHPSMILLLGRSPTIGRSVSPSRMPRWTCLRPGSATCWTSCSGHADDLTRRCLQ